MGGGMIKTYSRDMWITKSKFCLYIICCSPNNTADTITYVNNSILNNNLVWFQF